MGLLTSLLTLPVWGPIRGVLWLGGNIAEQAEDELYNEKRVREQLTKLELRYDLGEISEEEYTAAEDRLLELLKVIRERRKSSAREP